jgi:hypothetical protein
MNVSDRAWAAVVDIEQTALPPGPATGEPVFVVVRKSPAFPAGPAFVRGVILTERRRLQRIIALPVDHPVPLRSFKPPLTIAFGWTEARLDGLVGTCVPMNERDAKRIEAAMLELAHRSGPVAKRPKHSTPRTPGRRALLAGRAAARGSQGSPHP